MSRNSQVDLRNAYAREEYIPSAERNGHVNGALRPRSAGPGRAVESSPPHRPTSAHSRLFMAYGTSEEQPYIVTKAELRRRRPTEDGVSDRVRQIYADVGRVKKTKSNAPREMESLHEAMIALKHQLREEQDRRLKVAARNRRLEEVIAMKEKKLEEALAMKSQSGTHQIQREWASKERTHHHMLGKLREKIQQQASTIAAYEDTVNTLRSNMKHTHVMELEERNAQFLIEIDLACNKLETQEKMLEAYRKQLEDRSENAAQKTIKRLRAMVLALNEDKKRLEHENRVLKECLATERKRSPKKPKPPAAKPKALADESEFATSSNDCKKRIKSDSIRLEVDSKLAAKPQACRPPSAGVSYSRLATSMAGGAIVHRKADVDVQKLMKPIPPAKVAEKVNQPPQPQPTPVEILPAPEEGAPLASDEAKAPTLLPQPSQTTNAEEADVSQPRAIMTQGEPSQLPQDIQADAAPIPAPVVPLPTCLQASEHISSQPHEVKEIPRELIKPVHTFTNDEKKVFNDIVNESVDEQAKEDNDVDIERILNGAKESCQMDDEKTDDEEFEALMSFDTTPRSSVHGKCLVENYISLVLETTTTPENSTTNTEIQHSSAIDSNTNTACAVENGNDPKPQAAALKIQSSYRQHQLRKQNNSSTYNNLQANVATIVEPQQNPAFDAVEKNSPKSISMGDTDTTGVGIGDDHDSDNEKDILEVTHYHQVELNQNKSHSAALRIQSSFRQHLTKKSLKERNQKAAVKIQKQYRQHSSRVSSRATEKQESVCVNGEETKCDSPVSEVYSDDSSVSEPHADREEASTFNDRPDHQLVKDLDIDNHNAAAKIQRQFRAFSTRAQSINGEIVQSEINAVEHDKEYLIDVRSEPSEERLSIVNCASSDKELVDTPEPLVRGEPKEDAFNKPLAHDDRKENGLPCSPVMDNTKHDVVVETRDDLTTDDDLAQHTDRKDDATIEFAAQDDTIVIGLKESAIEEVATEANPSAVGEAKVVDSERDTDLLVLSNDAYDAAFDVESSTPRDTPRSSDSHDVQLITSVMKDLDADDANDSPGPLYDDEFEDGDDEEDAALDADADYLANELI